jgi:hypothetical protein
MSENKNKLITVGYPRSGNTFLSYALRAMYFPSEEINKNIHSPIELLNFNRELTIMPFRNPVDSIASWVNHGRNNMGDRNNSNLSIDSAIILYESMTRSAAASIERVVLFDFVEFTKNLSYIKNKIETYFNIISEVTLTIQDIIDEMVGLNKTFYIPNETILDEIKEQVLESERYSSVLEAYSIMVEAHELQS